MFFNIIVVENEDVGNRPVIFRLAGFVEDESVAYLNALYKYEVASSMLDFFWPSNVEWYFEKDLAIIWVEEI